jgi:hypothetical protein
MDEYEIGDTIYVKPNYLQGIVFDFSATRKDGIFVEVDVDGDIRIILFKP